MTATAIDELEFEGEPIRQSRLTFKGSVMAPAFHRGEEVALVATAKVGGVSFDDVKDVATRTQKAPVSKATVIDLDLAEDLLDEQYERTTGQLKLLSVEGESRRAARAVLDLRRDYVTEHEDVIEEEDAHEDPVAFVNEVEGTYFVTLSKLVGEADSMAVDEWLRRCEEELAAAGTRMLAGIEWCRRRQAEHAETERAKAVDAARVEAERAQEASAVHSDEEADKRERRGVEGEESVEGNEP